MSEALSQYRRLQDDLYQVRLLGLRFGEDLLEKAEDAVLDHMDGVWEKLGAEEKSLIQSEPPRCWPDAGAAGLATLPEK